MIHGDDVVSGAEPGEVVAAVVERLVAGRRLGTAADAAAVCGVEPQTYRWYVRYHGAPGPVLVDGEPMLDASTWPPSRLFDLGEVQVWEDSRRGPGAWPDSNLHRTDLRCEVFAAAATGRLGVVGDRVLFRGREAPRSWRRPVADLRRVGWLQQHRKVLRLTAAGRRVYREWSAVGEPAAATGGHP